VGRSALRQALVASGVVLALALAAGVVRLLPWLLSPEVPLRVALPFAKALAAVAVETAFFVGVPIGFCFAAAEAVERGEARALFALGVSPFGVVRGAVRHVALLGVAAFALGVAWDADASMPGRFARRLVEQARASCATVENPTTALVPLVGVTWLCFPDRTPRVVGTLPGFGDRAWFSAATLVPSDDLRSIELSDLRIATKKTDSSPPLRLHVGSAHIAGLAPWGRPAKLDVVSRALLLVSTATLLALLAAWVTLRRATESRLSAAFVSGSSVLVSLAVLHALDKGPLSNAAYALVPVVGAGALFVATAVDGIARRWRERGRGPFAGRQR
jgi:hypothetical protein